MTRGGVRTAPGGAAVTSPAPAGCLVISAGSRMLVDAVATRLSAEGLDVVVAPEAALATATPRLLVLPWAPALPVAAADSVGRHLRGGGSLLLLGAPLWPGGAETGLVLDLVAPSWKYFAVTEPSALSVRSDQCWVPHARLPAAAGLASPHPRADGGFDKRRGWRFLSLVEAHTASGRWSGVPVSVALRVGGAFAGSSVASLSVQDEEWYMQPVVLDMVGALAPRLETPTLLIDGGAAEYAAFEGDSMRVGVRAATLGAHGVSALARVTVRGDDVPAVVREWPLELLPGVVGSAEAEVALDPLPGDAWQVTAELAVEGRVIDRIEHPLRRVRPSGSPRFVSVADGRFQVDGTPWAAHGVNWMPSSGVAADDFAYFHQFLGRPAYDPRVADRDLDRIADMGLTTVSVFLFDTDVDSLNLVDLLERMRARGLRANLTLRCAIPDVSEQEAIVAAPEEYARRVGPIIDRYRLAGNDVLFAYDLSWEPTFGPHHSRRRFDEAWRRWLADRYGDIVNAERDWACTIPRDATGAATSPSDEQMTSEGPWHRMVAAYRRFLDTLVYRGYSIAARAVRAADPNHLVSFRMWEAGNPDFRDHLPQQRVPFDFPYVAPAVDFFGPEAYGRIGDRDKVRAGVFTAAWARLAGPAHPVVWPEVGICVGAEHPSPENLARQARFFADMQEMVEESGGAGLIYWFHPGGYRPDDSGYDYGIVNPDGSDRPATGVVRAFSRRLDPAAQRPRVDEWIEVDRDAHSDGLNGVYRAAGPAFRAALAAGRHPGLRTAGTGTTSATCPLIAVGNTPCDGSNPPKHLDAAVDAIAVTVAGRSIAVENGADIAVDADEVAVRLDVTNLGEAAWLDGTAAGSVGLVHRDTGELCAALPHPVPPGGRVRVDVAVHPAAGGPCQLALRLDARGRTPFGETVRLRLRRD